MTRWLRYLTPKFGRLSPSHARGFGEGLASADGAIGYFGFGPFVVVFDLPVRFAKPDPPVHEIDARELIPSIEEMNAALSEAFERMRKKREQG